MLYYASLVISLHFRFMFIPAFYTRPAQPGDRFRLERLLSSARYLHNHLDWQPPHDWLGRQPFQLAFAGDQLIGALAAPPDPPEATWVRLAAVGDDLPPEAVLDPLWAAAQDSLRLKAMAVSCMLLEDWFAPHLQRWGFHFLNDVIVLRRERKTTSPAALPAPSGFHLRPAKATDVGALAAVDNAAFAPPWQYSKTVIRQAMAQALYTTVAEANGEVVGYQISSGGREGGHLARLAVRPDQQGRGIGRALAAEAVRFFEKRGAPRLTVNTQRDNAASIAVYRALDFEITNEHYEVWQFLVVR